MIRSISRLIRAARLAILSFVSGFFANAGDANTTSPTTKTRTTQRFATEYLMFIRQLSKGLVRSSHRASVSAFSAVSPSLIAQPACPRQLLVHADRARV